MTIARLEARARSVANGSPGKLYNPNICMDPLPLCHSRRVPRDVPRRLHFPHATPHSSPSVRSDLAQASSFKRPWRRSPPTLLPPKAQRRALLHPESTPIPHRGRQQAPNALHQHSLVLWRRRLLPPPPPPPPPPPHLTHNQLLV